MGWLISRQEATLEPAAARQRVMARLENIEDLSDPAAMLMAIVTDAVMIVEAYRGARHQVALLPELQRSVDALLLELSIIERTNQWAREAADAG